MTAKTSTRKPPVAGTVPAIAKSGTPGKRGDNGIDLDELAGYAEMFTSVEDAAALLSIGAAALQALLDDPVRRAQFELMAKNATLAVHLGKELLGQDGTAAGGPVTFVVDTGIQRDDG